VQYKPKIETQEIGSSEFIIKQLLGISNEMAVIKANLISSKSETYLPRTPSIKVGKTVLNTVVGMLNEFVKNEKIENISTLKDRIKEIEYFLSEKGTVFFNPENLKRVIDEYIENNSAF
jgi:hypothetical protein